MSNMCKILMEYKYNNFSNRKRNNLIIYVLEIKSNSSYIFVVKLILLYTFQWITKLFNNEIRKLSKIKRVNITTFLT